MEGKMHKFECKICHYKTNRKNNLIVHESSKKHKNNMNNKKSRFSCDMCNYHTDISSHFKRHIISAKHKANETNKANNEEEISLPKEETPLSGSHMMTEEMFMYLVNQNKKLMEVIENGTHVMTNCHNTNNNTFNLQFFLNETCKDAINIKDFIESIEVSIKDLKNLGKLGYVEGISGLMIQKLNDLEVTKRPIHSSDVKRETIYIKENDAWEKDNEQKERLKKVIREITKLETRALEDKYRIMYPQSQTDRNSKEHNEYWKIFHNAVGGAERDMDLLNSKIIRKIVQNVAIDKTKY